jgi:hypothetical protein
VAIYVVINIKGDEQKASERGTEDSAAAAVQTAFSLYRRVVLMWEVRNSETKQQTCMQIIVVQAAGAHIHWRALVLTNPGPCQTLPN